jgi:hypothetical protein
MKQNNGSFGFAVMLTAAIVSIVLTIIVAGCDTGVGGGGRSYNSTTGTPKPPGEDLTEEIPLAPPPPPLHSRQSSKIQ